LAAERKRDPAFRDRLPGLLGVPHELRQRAPCAQIFTQRGVLTGVLSAIRA